MPRRTLPSDEDQPTGQWIIRDVPRDVMARIKMAALLHRTSVKQLILELVQDYLRRLEQGRAGQSLFDVNLRWPPSPGAKQARGKRRKP